MFVADYISLRKGALIGRHFKSLAQVMPYLIHDLVSWTVLDGWTIIGRLEVLLCVEDAKYVDRQVRRKTCMSKDMYVERHVCRLTCTMGTFNHISVD